MQRTVTIHVKIDEGVILPLMKTCADVFNKHAIWAYKNKTTDKNRAHKDLYRVTREEHPDFPSGYVQTIRDNAMESTKALKEQQKELAKRKKSKRYRPSKNSKRYPEKPPKLYPTRRDTSCLRANLRTSTLRGDQFTFSTLGKRHKIVLNCPAYHLEIFRTWKYQSCTINYKHEKDLFSINLVFKADDVPLTTTPATTVNAIGIDRGVKNLFAFSDGELVSGKKVNGLRRKYLFVRKTCQEKGTQSSRRRLRARRGREQRFIRDVDHCTTKQISGKPFDYFVLEKLTGIRNADRGVKQNKRLANWSYLQQELFLGYKLEAKGKHMVFVNARHTSQKCNWCHHIAPGNRKGSVFLCLKCGHKKHADLQASDNIRDDYLSQGVKTEEQGVKVKRPNVSWRPRGLQATRLAAVGLQAPGLVPGVS